MQTSKEKDLNILDLFEAHETAMHDIYSLFASRYGDYEDFWRGIAEEEKVHARWIRSIRSKVETEDLKVVADMVSVATIENSLEYMKAQIMDFSSQENSVDRAFELAMRIENSIVERAIFDIVRTESEDIKKILLNLEEKTSQHYFRIKEMAKTRTRLHGLVDSGILSASDLASVYETAAKEGQSAEWLVMEQYKIPKAALLKSIGAFCNLPQWSFDKQNPCFPTGLSQTLAGKYETLKSELFVPVAQEGRKIIVAVADPMDIVKTDYIKKYFSNHHVEFRVGIPDDISAAVDTFFGIQNEAIGESIPKILDVMKSEAMVDAVDEESAEQEISENDNIVVRLVNNIIIDAANFNASDIHIEPSLDDDVRVRYRIDGMMSYAHVFPRKFQGAVCSRIKIMAGLDIAERRKPQSGQIRFKRWGPSDIELRVETYSTVSGAEDIVMRILSSSKPLPLAQLNFSRYNLDEFTRLISQPYGIILCVGPTGSGKTTTLHSALKYLNREDTKILTAEDPVEITQTGLRQTQMNPRSGITFASAMRSFLRADPDVIMIGEMRDLETAAIAIEASLTGHLVLSTLHTNSAPETIVRLIEMGIDPYSFADSLIGILAQRLVRMLCPECKQAVNLDDHEIELFRQEYASPRLFEDLLNQYGRTLYAAHEGGCDNCRGKGYKGRIPIHELLTITERIKELVYRRAPASEIRKIAIQEGMIVLRQDGIEKVFSGKTTLEEIRAVTSR